MSKRILYLLLVSIVLIIFAGTDAVQAEQNDKYYSLVDEKNQVINQTGTQVYVGDIFISADNSKYRVVEVAGTTAKCVYQGKEPMPSLDEATTSQAGPVSGAIPVAGGKKPTIAVYHTHSDESYVPSDGKESINGKGGIYDVGASFVKQLKAQGFNVIYNTNNHNPHDINAYNRSRKTASALLKDMPAAIIDVHRDSTPPGEYQTSVKGMDVTKVKLVVGRSNPNSKTNLEFAKRLKAAMDKKEPGLSEGIFMGKGDYNQDLSPRAMLIEVGAHTNTKGEAERGVKLFAQILPSVLGVATAPTTGNTSTAAKKPLQQNNQGSGTAIVVILVIAAVVIGGFYLLNRGSSSQKQ